MATLLERLAEDLARDAIEHAERTGDEKIIDAIAKSLADTSTTFQEAYLTAVRYYRAEVRARELFPAHEPDAAIALPGPDTPRPPGAEGGERKEQDHGSASPDDGEVPYAEAEVVEDGDQGFGAGGRRSRKSGDGEVTGPRKAGR